MGCTAQVSEYFVGFDAGINVRFSHGVIINIKISLFCQVRIRVSGEATQRHDSDARPTAASSGMRLLMWKK